MDQARLIKAREYYDMTRGGTPRAEAALAIVGDKSPNLIENTPEYLAIVAAASQVEKEKLKHEIEQVKRKQIKTYSDLLDKGAELMDEANTIEEKIAAQTNQRANLASGVVENAISWDGEDRNKNDMGDILEGVIL